MTQTQTYTRTDGRVLDLSELTPEERAFLDRSFAAYQDGAGWDDFSRLVGGMENPLVRAAGGWVTRAMSDHPLWLALRDLEDRVGIRRGNLRADPGADLDSNPFADEWLPVSEAEERKGVSHNALHAAIKRGDVVARPAKEGGSWLVVSRRSLDHWLPNAARQAARRSRSAAATTP
ncbi:MAG: hypothetical protein NTZ05_20375 [Chloroflexi bacterium]|nr:hypothetical protein [Chloroflexota bacterium]